MNGLRRGLFGPNRKEVIGDWRKLDHMKLHIFCSLRNVISVKQIKENEMGKAFSANDDDEKCAQNFCWKV